MSSTGEATQASLEHLLELTRVNSEQINQEIDDIRMFTANPETSEMQVMSKHTWRLIYLDDVRKSLEAQIAQLLRYISDEATDT